MLIYLIYYIENTLHQMIENKFLVSVETVNKLRRYSDNTLFEI